MPGTSRHTIGGGLALLALTLCAVPANASTITVAANLGPVGTYGPVVFDLQSDLAEAASFTPRLSAWLWDVMLPLSDLSGPPSVTVGIASDNSGLPGAVLATLTQIGTIPSSGSALVTFTCDECVALESGKLYWLVAGASNTSTVALWDSSDIALSGNFASSDTGSVNGPWSTPAGIHFFTPAFEVDGVPEPTSMLLIATGVLGIALPAASARRVRNP